MRQSAYYLGNINLQFQDANSLVKILKCVTHLGNSEEFYSTFIENWDDFSEILLNLAFLSFIFDNTKDNTRTRKSLIRHTSIVCY